MGGPHSPCLNLGTGPSPLASVTSVTPEGMFDRRLGLHSEPGRLYLPDQQGYRVIVCDSVHFVGNYRCASNLCGLRRVRCRSSSSAVFSPRRARRSSARSNAQGAANFTYSTLVNSRNPVSYLMMDESSGTNALDSSPATGGNGTHPGTYAASGITYGQPSAGPNLNTAIKANGAVTPSPSPAARRSTASAPATSPSNSGLTRPTSPPAKTCSPTRAEAATSASTCRRRRWTG